jgi:modified peptide precursor CbpA
VRQDVLLTLRVREIAMKSPHAEREEYGHAERPWFLERKEERMTKQTKKAVIAYRKTCQAKGTGLSHYILMDKKAK